MNARCPECGKPVDPLRKVPWRPFCSERCRLVDLGAWLDESRRIPMEEASSASEVPHDSMREACG